MIHSPHPVREGARKNAERCASAERLAVLLSCLPRNLCMRRPMLLSGGSGDFPGDTLFSRFFVYADSEKNKKEGSENVKDL